MKYYFKKHRIKIFFLLVLSLIVFGCSFLIKEVNVKQENEAGEMVAYIKAGEIATFTFSGEINIDGDASNETFIVGFLAPRSWNVRQNATVTYREDRYETEVDHKMTVIPDTEQPANGIPHAGHPNTQQRGVAYSWWREGRIREVRGTSGESPKKSPNR